jgi:predicted Zn-dependent peptidase
MKRISQVLSKSATVAACLVLLSGSLALAQPDRAKAPAATGPAPSLRVPATTRFTLKNGLPVHFVSKPGLPLIQLQLVVRSGTTSDPAGAEGLAVITANLMREAAGARTNQQFNEEIEFLGVNLSINAGIERSTVSLYGPVRQLEPALKLMNDLVVSPRLDQADFDRLKKRALAQQLSQRDQPGYIAEVAFAQRLFGAMHAYGRPAGGTVSSLSGLNLDQAKSFWKQHYVPANAYLVVVGEITEAALKQQLEATLGNWQGATAPVASQVAEVKAPKGRTIFLVDRPGSAQSEVRVGHLGLARTTPDYHAVQVMNTLLGASFTSRLNSNLREKNGYAYGASSGYRYRTKPGPFVAASAVETSVTDKAVREFLNELKGIRTISAAELDKTRNYIALSYPSDFEGVGGIGAQVADRVFYGLPDDSFDRFIPSVLGVDAKAIAKAAQSYVHPDDLVIVVVGDAAKIEAGLRAQKYGNVVKVSIADVLGPAQ